MPRLESNGGHAMTNETLKKHEKLCDICQITNPENKIGKRLATKAIKRNLENNDNGLCLNVPNKNKPKKQITGELYDTQGIEGLARVGDSKKQTVKEHETSIIDIGKSKKLTGREWIIQRFIEWNYGESNCSFGTQELHHAIDLTEAEERGKCKSDFARMFVDAAKDAEEKGRREILEDIFKYGSWLRVQELAKEYGVKP